MRTVEEFKYLQDEVAGWRRYLHQHPELDFAVHNTAAFVVEKLTSFGINHIETGIAETGIVALVLGQGGEGPTIGLRADMDALPIVEVSGKPWSSRSEGRMHACGHDGHMAMLLGAAKYLAATRNFSGSVALIFQPAEEVELPSGALKMVQDGFLGRYNIDRVFGMHNWPGLGIGHFAGREGSLMASQDDFDIVVKGRGGHAATPHRTVDPVVIAAQIIVALQTLVSRNTDPTESLVISVTKLGASQAYNVIPDRVAIAGTVRSLSADLRDFAERRMRECAQGIARGLGAEIDFTYRRSVPVTFNHKDEFDMAIQAACDLVGPSRVDGTIKAVMGSEDFAYMLEARPGAFVFIGNGTTAAVHNPHYDFNDEAIPYGIGYWVSLVESALPHHK